MGHGVNQGRVDRAGGARHGDLLDLGQRALVKGDVPVRTSRNEREVVQGRKNVHGRRADPVGLVDRDPSVLVMQECLGCPAVRGEAEAIPPGGVHRDDRTDLAGVADKDHLLDPPGCGSTPGEGRLVCLVDHQHLGDAHEPGARQRDRCDGPNVGDTMRIAVRLRRGGAVFGPMQQRVQAGCIAVAEVEVDLARVQCLE